MKNYIKIDQQVQWLSQILAKANRTFLEPKFNDSHTNFYFDDMGKDATVGFSEGNIKPNTPNINNIKYKRLSFNNFWSYPTCSPTRASILTGKYGYRTNVLSPGDALSTTETSLQQYINQQTSNVKVMELNISLDYLVAALATITIGH